MTMVVLFLGAHTDDIELGAGATMMRLASQPHNEVHYVSFSRCTDIPRNASIRDDQAKVLAYLKQHSITASMMDYPNRELAQHGSTIRHDMEVLRDRIRPDVVFAHWSGDIHQDHKVIAEETWRVFRNHTLLVYEVLHSCPSFTSNYFVKLDQDDISKKQYLMSLYQTQSQLGYCQPETIEALARIRGAEIEAQYAEAFYAVRIVRNTTCAL